jgi:integrase
MDDRIEILNYTAHLAGTDRISAGKLYASMLGKFSFWLKHSKRDFSTFTTVDAESYLHTIANENTYNAFLAALKGYMKFRCASLPVDSGNVMRETQRFNQINILRAKQVKPKREKVSLTPDELRSLLQTIEKNEKNDLVYSGAVVQFYFGARPSELAVWLRSANINWEKRSMVIMTCKTHRERFLAWHEKITPHLNKWYSALPVSENGKWITRRLGHYSVDGMKVTAKTGRKTLQTQFRLRGIDDMIIDMILGHSSRSSKIGDVYTDFEQFDARIRDVMVNKHYMIQENII